MLYEVSLKWTPEHQYYFLCLAVPEWSPQAPQYEQQDTKGAAVIQKFECFTVLWKTMYMQYNVNTKPHRSIQNHHICISHASKLENFEDTHFFSLSCSLLLLLYQKKKFWTNLSILMYQILKKYCFSDVDDKKTF